jgi:toxin ParE1/3/4
MVKKVIYLEIAVDDLASIYRYISRDSIKYAKLEVKKIKAFCESLRSQPAKGRFYQTIKGKDIRSAVFRNYIVFYINEQNEQISILTIHHHSRLISNNPAFKGEE